MKDMVNEDINIGDYVAYATRVGNSGEMLVGKVLDVEEEGCSVIAARVGWWNQKGTLSVNSKKSYWTNSKNTLKLGSIPNKVKDELDTWGVSDE